MRDGDLLVVDRSLRPQNRDIVIAEVDGASQLNSSRLLRSWPFCP